MAYKRARDSVVMLYIYSRDSSARKKKNETNRKRRLPFVCCKWKTEMASFRLFAANVNRKQKFVSLVGK
jgi:hypothetical protein